MQRLWKCVAGAAVMALAMATAAPAAAQTGPDPAGQLEELTAPGGVAEELAGLVEATGPRARPASAGCGWS